MKKYNIIVALFAVASVIYMLKLKAFSLVLLNERALGKTDLELLINNKEDILLYVALALAFVITAALITYRILKEVRGGSFEEYINMSVLCFILIIIITIVIKLITIPVMQILLSGFAIVGGISALIGSDS